MWKIWFKFKLGPDYAENCAIFEVREEAQKAWDELSAAGWYMMSTRP